MVKIYQISLHGGAYDARGKTLNTIENETGCRPMHGWRDPLLKRPMLIGEVGCAISHMRVWEKIAESGEAGLILEEDAVYGEIDLNNLADILKTHDAAWLGYRPNDMGYWYNAHAYAITADTARYLLSQRFGDALAPVDEFLPYCLSGGEYGAYKGNSVEKKKNYFYTPPIIGQIPRNKRQSQIEGTRTVTNSEIQLITVATDPDKAEALVKSAAKYGWVLTALGVMADWKDSMNSYGGFPKIEFVRDHLEAVDPDAIVMFLDGYDCIVLDTEDEVLERFLGFGVDILFGAESNLWPNWDYSHDYPVSHTPYRYLNSGQYIGRAWAIKKFLEKRDDDEGIDDQAFFHQRFLSNTDLNIALDYECYIFQNHEPQITKVRDQLYNPITNVHPCTYHGNGGSDAKAVFYNVVSWFFEDAIKMPYYNQLDYEVVADEMLVTPLLTEDECKLLIELSEAAGGWQSMDGDKFPAQEIRIKRLGLWATFDKMWQDKLGKIVEKHWPPVMHYGLRDAFTMRYTMDTQTSLGLHTDASLVTGSVKLNSDYSGAELVFPRQGFSNIDVPVGHCILFPAQVTHGHKVEPLTGGVKYSLTMWTSRFKGDVN